MAGAGPRASACKNTVSTESGPCTLSATKPTLEEGYGEDRQSVNQSPHTGAPLPTGIEFTVTMEQVTELQIDMGTGVILCGCLAVVVQVILTGDEGVDGTAMHTTGWAGANTGANG